MKTTVKYSVTFCENNLPKTTTTEYMDARTLGYLLTDGAYEIIQILKITTHKRFFGKTTQKVEVLDPEDERMSIFGLVNCFTAQ